jgi:hypothetical protein
MSEEKTYQGIRAGDAWIAGGPITMSEAEDLIEEHMKGASVEINFWLEEEADHLVASFLDRDQSARENPPRGRNITRDETWSPVKTGSHKRREFPMP